jgi:hypothetical protein
MKKILIFSLAAMLGLVTCTERPEQIIDPVYDRLFSPTDVKAEVQAIVNATVTWKEVEHASGYTLELFNAPEPAEGTTPYRIDETEGTSFRYENLPEDVEFAVRIKAVSENLPESKWTALVTFKTTPPPPPVTTEWNFSDDEFAEIPTTNDYKQTLTVRGLDVVGGTGGVGRTTVNVAIDDYTFTWRLDLRGGGAVGSDLASSNRVIHVKADNPCVITVYAHSSSAGRTLKITDKNDNTLGEYLTTGTTPGKVDVNVAEATDIYIYSAGSGIEVYLVKMVVGGVYEPDHTATLRALAVTGETLVPAFDPETTNYTIGVAKSVEKVTITTAKGHPNQTVEGDGEHPLTGDVTAIPVRVTAEDGTTVNTYTITVNREATASSDATLKTLTASPGNLTPAFDPAVTEYEVTTTAEKVTITAEASHKFAKVGNSGSFEADNLVVSVPSIVTIPVLAEDLTTKIYTVTVTRQETPSSGGPTTKMWNFSDAAFETAFAGVSGTVTEASLIVDGVTFLTNLQYDGSSKLIDGHIFTKRVKLGGTGSTTSRALKFDVDGPSTITVYALSSSSGVDRNLIVHDGTTQLGIITAPGTATDAETGKGSVSTSAAGSIYIYSSNSGINIYGIYVETASGGGGGGGGDDDTPGTVVNGFYVITDEEYFHTSKDNINAMEWVTYAADNYTDRSATTDCEAGVVPNLSGSARVVVFKIKGASSVTIKVRGNGTRYLTYIVNDTPTQSKLYANSCDTETISTGTTGECTVQVAGFDGSVYLHGITFHKE